MFLTVHATAGAMIGQATGNIWLGFLAGIVSHYLLDIIPHGDETLIKDEKNIGKKDILFIFKIATLDGMIMSILLITLYWQNLIPLTLPVLAGIAGSIFPDAVNGVYMITKHPWLQKSSKFHFDLHHILKIHVSFKTGLVIQFAIVLFLVYLLL